VKCCAGKTFLYDALTAVLPGLVLTFTILSLDTIGRAHWPPCWPIATSATPSEPAAGRRT
jgi:hypothetical protein